MLAEASKADWRPWRCAFARIWRIRVQRWFPLLRPLPRPALHRGPAAAARSSAPRNPAFAIAGVAGKRSH